MARTVDAAGGAVTASDEDVEWYQAYGYDPGHRTSADGGRAADADSDAEPRDGAVEAEEETRPTGGPDPVEDAAEPVPSTGEEPPLLGRGVRAGLVALAASVVVLLAAGVVFGLQWWGGVTEENRRPEVVEAARQVALNLTSITFESADADVNRVIDSSTGDFRNLFTQNLDAYVQVVKENEVLTTGQIAEAGLSDLDDDVAHVLVAVQSNVRNKAAPDGETRTYRMDLQMDRQSDGAWLVSRVDFVP